MRKLSIIGHFGFGKELLNGQTIKTKIVSDALIKELGAESVAMIDTHGGKKRALKILRDSYFALKASEQVLIAPAASAAKVIIPFLVFFNRFYKRKLYLLEIGGWLRAKLKSKRFRRYFSRFEKLFIETSENINLLNDFGLHNTEFVPNCKLLNILNKTELIIANNEPYKLCTFSRVMKEKGIEDAVNAVKSVNEQLGRTAYTLDIYGQIDGNQTEWFEKLQQDFPEYVRYGGIVAFDKSVDVLKDYFALLFPTHYYTEGIPGTIIDAYAAGVPVISARWENYKDVIDDAETGLCYDMEKTDELQVYLLEVVNNPKKLLDMKVKCLQKSKTFTPNEALKPLFEVMVNREEK